MAAYEYPGVSYLDVFALMLSPGGGARPELFTGDGLHMNSNGYALWAARIRTWLESLDHQATAEDKA
jgi:lysophospholipase L1-like esterase